jgi:hypothetical protein
VGSEFQVNLYTEDSQYLPSVAVAANGDFIITWYRRTPLVQGYWGWDIAARRFSSAGNALGTEFTVNTYTPGPQYNPAIAADADGDFVVVWVSEEISARRFSSVGGELANEFVVNTYTLSDQFVPAVAANADGDFIIAWESTGHGDAGIFARRFSSAGTPYTDEFTVSLSTSAANVSPAVAMDADGDAIVVWMRSEPGAGSGIFGHLYSNDGIPVASEFQVNSFSGYGKGHPMVTADADGDFVVVWEDSHQDGGPYYGIFGRVLASDGAPLTDEFQVNVYTEETQRLASVASESDGDFVVSWNDLVQDGSGYGVFARHFSSSGAPLTSELQVNTHTEFSQAHSSVATDGGSRFVVAWMDYAQDGSFQGIFAQRFVADPVTIDVDASGDIDPLTDGILLLRYMFGFRSETLTSGATGDDCTRCTAPEIENYLSSILLDLDVDANGETGPLTDGLLLLRYFFGFQGAALISGAVGPGCTRCTADEIESYIEGLAV